MNRCRQAAVQAVAAISSQEQVLLSRDIYASLKHVVEGARTGLRFRASGADVCWAANIKRFAPHSFADPLLQTFQASGQRCEMASTSYSWARHPMLPYSARRLRFPFHCTDPSKDAACAQQCFASFWEYMANAGALAMNRKCLPPVGFPQSDD
jgi:hypothetical protein